MFTFYAHPDISDEFLVTHTLARVLSRRCPVGLTPIPSDRGIPSFTNGCLSLFSHKPETSDIAIWSGLPKYMAIQNESNLAYITEWRENIEMYKTLSQIDTTWIVGAKDFPYPCIPSGISIADISDRSGIFIYALPLFGRMIWETIEAWAMSDSIEPLRVFAPMQDAKIFKSKIHHIKNQYNKKVPIYLSTSQFFTPDQVTNEIIKSKYVIDMRSHRGISYSSLVATANGIPSLGSNLTFPETNVIINNIDMKKCSDNSRMHGEYEHIYRLADIAQAIDQLMILLDGPIFDNSNGIYDIVVETQMKNGWYDNVEEY